MFKRCAQTLAVALLVTPSLAQLAAAQSTQSEDAVLEQELAATSASSLDNLDLTGLELDMKALQPAWLEPECIDAKGKPTRFEGCALGQGQVRPGFVPYTWEPGAQMRIFMRPRMNTVIRFEPGTVLLTPIVGDDKNFEALNDQDQNNLIWVRSTNYNIDTDLKVRDSHGNLYSFVLMSMPEDSPNLTATEVSVNRAKTLRSKLAHTVSIGEDNTRVSTNNPTAKQPASDASKTSDDQSGAITPEELAGMSARRVAQDKNRADYLRRLSVNLDNLICDRDAYDVKAPTEKAASELSPEHVCTDGVFTIFDYGERSDTIKRAGVFQIIDEVDYNIPSYKWTGAKSQMLVVEVTGDFSMILGESYICFISKLQQEPPAIVDVGGV